jgi:CDP-paratose 2-epimerase
MMKVLITGGAGFVGSSLAILLKQKYPGYSVICFDNLKRRGSELNITRLSEHGIEFIHGDIRNKEDFNEIPKDVTSLIEASAEPSVLAGINGTPDYLINTNMFGTINCLNFATSVKASLIFLSTSRVYPIEKLEEINFNETTTRFEIAAKQQLVGLTQRGLSEDFPINGFRSFYGTTKLASEFFIQEYHKYYNLKSVINRCGVIAGPWQMGKVDQGVISLWVARHYWKKKIAYFGYGGEGKQVRDVLHVKDLFNLIDFQLHNFDTVNGKLMNAGGGQNTSTSLLELTEICEAITGNKIECDSVKENRAADIRIYITDNSYVTKLSGWTPKTSMKDIVTDVFQWMRENETQLKKILN